MICQDSRASGTADTNGGDGRGEGGLGSRTAGETVPGGRTAGEGGAGDRAGAEDGGERGGVSPTADGSGLADDLAPSTSSTTPAVPAITPAGPAIMPVGPATAPALPATTPALPAARTPAPAAAGRRPFLYVVLCAAGIADDVSKLIATAQQRTWRVGVIATPRGRECVDAAAIEAQTGYPVRSAWRMPGEPRPLPPADAIAVAPATFNTINKWAQGIADTLALAILCEAHGIGIPIAALPYLNAAQAAHPAYAQSLARLRRMGVLLGDYAPHQPRTGGGRRSFRWEQALDLLAPALERL
ncbi:hypothetical protein GCM10010361_29780 [Streptomyces olivaceiscleroticus]|uniref:Flavoprotein domain-containing protein n=2 Tax=Streptomyces olivaceiscleroticus TaxID=68245 RepID=A0ABN0ZZJ1_9ACTN